MPVVGVLSFSRGFPTTCRLLEAAEGLGLEARHVDPLRVVLRVGPDGPALVQDGAALEVPDLVVPRIGATHTEWGLACLEALVLAGAWSPVSADAMRRASDKLRSAACLAAAGLPVVPSVAVREPAQVEGALDLVDAGRAAGGGYVLKLRRGNQGRQVGLAPDRRSARSVIETLVALGEVVLVQPFVPSGGPAGAARDLRVLVAGGRPLAAMERIATAGEFRANVHRGAAVRAIDPPPEAVDLALRAASALEVPFAGVDLLPLENGGGGTFAVLEVNPSPGLEGIEAATGRDLATELLRSMLEARNAAGATRAASG